MILKLKSNRLEKKVAKLSKKDIDNLIDDYSNEILTKTDLQEKIGVLEMAKHKTLLDHIDDILA